MKILKLKPKPMERNNKIDVPEELEPVKRLEKPKIKLNASDKINIWLNKTEEVIAKIAESAIAKIIPWWFWIAIIIITAYVIIN